MNEQSTYNRRQQKAIQTGSHSNSLKQRQQHKHFREAECSNSIRQQTKTPVNRKSPLPTKIFQTYTRKCRSPDTSGQHPRRQTRRKQDKKQLHQISKSAGHNERSMLARLKDQQYESMTAFNNITGVRTSQAPENGPGTGNITDAMVNGNLSRFNLNHNNISSWAIRNVAVGDEEPETWGPTLPDSINCVPQIPEQDKTIHNHVDTPRCRPTTATGRLPDNVMSGEQVHSVQYSVIPHWPGSSTVHANINDTSTSHTESNQMDSSEYIKHNY